MTAPTERLAERVLELVGRAEAGAEAAVTVTRQTLALTRFAESFIHQNVADERDEIGLQVHVDGRTAVATGTSTTDEALGELVQQALTAARLRPVDPGYPGLAPPAAVRGTGNVDPATATADPAARAEVVRAFVAGTEGLSCAGYCQTRGQEVAFANSAGQAVRGATSDASFSAVARTGRSGGVARDAAVSLTDLDGARLGAAAAAKARAGTEQIDLPPDRYQVVLEAGAVADLVGGLFLPGFNGKAVAEGRSFVRLGEAQFDAAVSLWSDSTDERACGLPFDAEGTPRGRVDFVRAGVTGAAAHDRRTAAAVDATSNGGALPGGGRWGAFPADVRLAPGDATDLIAGVERGILVSDFWYTRVLDPRTVVYTGLTRNGAWLIEDGQLGPALSTLRFTQSYLDALAPGAVLGVGHEQHAHPGGIFFGATGGSLLVPHLRLASWNITGGAAG